MTAFDFKTFKGLSENERIAYIRGFSEISYKDCESIVKFLMKTFDGYGSLVIYESSPGYHENIDFTNSVWMPLVELFKKDPAKLFIACRGECPDEEHQSVFNDDDLCCDCIYKTIIEVSDPITRIINELDFQLCRMVSGFKQYSIDFDLIQRRIAEIDEFIAFRDEFLDKHQDVKFPEYLIERVQNVVKGKKTHYERIMSLRDPIQDFVTRFEQIAGTEQDFSQFYTFAASEFRDYYAQRAYKHVIDKTRRYMQFVKSRTGVICKDNDTAKSLCGLIAEISDFYADAIGVEE